MENLKCLFTNFPLDIFLFWLLPLLLLWWLLNRLINRHNSHASQLKERIEFLETELEACRNTKISKNVNIDNLKSFEVPVAIIPESKPIKKDDLKIVEGIGPKIEELCHAAGIFTFSELAMTESSKIKKILESAGSRFQMHDPSTWPEQAALARDGKWDELKKWQDELNKGKV
jgi:predicted flap endonuclease-1-like 5' DNA nuclease